jgi:cytochrome oxidase Cu insertion factor (SCO1/SenC/PrrC family)
MRRPARAAQDLLVLAAAVAFTAGVAFGADPAAAMIGQTAPLFRLTDVLSGKTVSLEDLRGRTVVLHFGASW